MVNAIIGFIQEGKAESALEAIPSMLSPHATVLREGPRLDIDAADLVPGDRQLLAPATPGHEQVADRGVIHRRPEAIDDEVAAVGHPHGGSPDSGFEGELDAPVGD